MFGFGPATRIYVATGTTDMRKHFNGLYGLVRDHLCCNPESRHVFPFTNARRNRLKLLVYDRSGLWVCTKKAGPWLFQVAWCRQRGEENRAELSGVEPVLGCIDLAKTELRKWYRKAPAEESAESLKTV